MPETALKQAFSTHPRTNTLLNLGEAYLTWSRQEVDFAFYVLSRLRKGDLYASQATLAKHESIHEDTAGKYLRDFKEIGLITITKRERQTNLYKLCEPFCSDAMIGILFSTLKELSEIVIKPIYLLSNLQKSITISRVTGLLNKVLIRINSLIRALAYKGLTKKIKKILNTQNIKTIANEQTHKLISLFGINILSEAIRQHKANTYSSYNFIFFKCLQFCKEMRTKPKYWKYIQRIGKKGYAMLKQYEEMQARIRKENQQIDKDRKHIYQKPDPHAGNSIASQTKYVVHPVIKTDPCELYHKASRAAKNIFNFFAKQVLQDTVLSLKPEHDELALLGKCQECR